MTIGGYKLTPRQMDCLYYVDQCMTDKEIGAALNLSRRTVNFHLRCAGEALDVNGTSARWRCVRKAMLLGFPIHLEPELRRARFADQERKR